MLRELVEKAEKLELKGQLNSLGYSNYSESIKYVIHLYPETDCNRIEIEEYAGENRPRAKPANLAGKAIIPYPFADEAGYVLNYANKKDGTLDADAGKKHEEYLNLLEEMTKSKHFCEPLLMEAIQSVMNTIQAGSILEAFSGRELLNKTWITFVYEKEWLKGKHLHELKQTKNYWAEKVGEKVLSGVEQECSICGKRANTVKNLPTKTVFKGGGRQLSSLNENAFVSYQFQKKEASLGICLDCAEKPSQALNYLLSKTSQNIYEDKDTSGKVNKDSPRNQVAVYWLKEEMMISLDTQEYNPLDIISIPLGQKQQIQVETTDELIEKFLKSPWSGQASSLNLDENTFCLAILSPNGPGRIAVRDWIQASSKTIKKNLSQYFEAMNLVDVYDQKRRPYVLQELLEPLLDVDPNMGRFLLRSAYLGEPPPFSLFQSAIRRLRISGARDGTLIENKNAEKKKKGIEPIEVWQRLCTIIKFYLTFGREEALSMESLNRNRDVVAYQAGILFAILEEIQRRAATGKLSSTLVDKYYGSASTAPLTVLPALISMTTKAHMPKIRKNNYFKYQELEDLLEAAIIQIDEGGGLPRTLTLAQQGEFALGFYHQRADFNSSRAK